jgi:hypothetical protein
VVRHWTVANATERSGCASGSKSGRVMSNMGTRTMVAANTRNGARPSHFRHSVACSTTNVAWRSRPSPTIARLCSRSWQRGNRGRNVWPQMATGKACWFRFTGDPCPSIGGIVRARLLRTEAQTNNHGSPAYVSRRSTRTESNHTAILWAPPGITWLLQGARNYRLPVKFEPINKNLKSTWFQRQLEFP